MILILAIVMSSCLDNNVPRAPTYGVYISQHSVCKSVK